MTLRNAFDIGTCIVSADGLWSGILSKGQSSPTFAGNLSGEVVQINVDSSGNVALNWISGTGPSNGYQLQVVPTYSLDAATVIQVSGINMPIGVSGQAQAFANPSGPNVGNPYLTGSGSAWSPDPADVTANIITGNNENGWYVWSGAAE